ncbi:MAG: hypothetical protein V7637_3445 [Mycobacteriales bacterium]|jgi:myo-inositol 2-dehydrogenase/D-chiro-inositol 1-dehydrogenase
MRIGLLGAGRIGAFHAATLLDTPDVAGPVIGDVAAAPAVALAEKLAGGSAAGPAGGIRSGAAYVAGVRR